MMKQFLAFTALSALTIAFGVLAFSPAFAGPVAYAEAEVLASEPSADMVPIAADCYAIGEDVAAQNGGTVAKAVPAMDGDQPVCKIVVLIPGQEGERPKRKEFIVPQN